MGYSDPLMMYARSVVSDYYDFEGRRVRPYPTKERLKKGAPSNAANDFLRQFVWLLMEDNGFIHAETKLYLAFPKLTQGQIGEKLVEVGLRTEAKKANSVKAIIYLDRKKMRDYFPKDMLSRVVDYKDTDLSTYYEYLADARGSLKINKLWGNLALKVPRGEEQQTGEIGTERFMEFYRTIAPYTRAQMAFVEENMDAETVGYVRRILIGGRLTKDEQRHRLMLLELLSS